MKNISYMNNFSHEYIPTKRRERQFEKRRKRNNYFANIDLDIQRSNSWRLSAAIFYSLHFFVDSFLLLSLHAIFYREILTNRSRPMSFVKHPRIPALSPFPLITQFPRISVLLDGFYISPLFSSCSPFPFLGTLYEFCARVQNYSTGNRIRTHDFS